jgi:hypothetical protein
MFGRVWLLGMGGLALLCLIVAPGQLSAQGRGPAGGRPGAFPTGGVPVGGMPAVGFPTSGVPVGRGPLWQRSRRFSAGFSTGWGAGGVRTSRCSHHQCQRQCRRHSSGCRSSSSGCSRLRCQQHRQHNCHHSRCGRRR